MKRVRWGLLLHVGTSIDGHLVDHVVTDRDTFRRVTDRMAEDGLNMVLIDVLEALRYEKHPELAVRGSIAPDKFMEELDRLRKIGLEPLPKLNFSTAHHDWLGPYARRVSTPAYYEVCSDVIADVAQVFGHPPLFHIGMDEESYRFVRKRDYMVLRQGDLWWHDLAFLAKQVESHGARPWMWCDRYWYHRDEVVARASKNIVMANYYYGTLTDPAPYLKIFDKDPIGYCGMTTYANLEKDGFDQFPTCSNYLSPGYKKNHPGEHNLINTSWTVEHCLKTISPKHLLGFLSAPWEPCVPDMFDYLAEASRLLGDAKRRFCS